MYVLCSLRLRFERFFIRGGEVWKIGVKVCTNTPMEMVPCICMAGVGNGVNAASCGKDIKGAVASA